MLISLPIPVIILLDIFGWLVIHLGVASFMFKLNEKSFNPNSWLFRTRKWEYKGSIYQRFLRIKIWKEKLPDGASLFTNTFGKKHLGPHEITHYEAFVIETCRGELTHWIVIGFAPVFFIWNWWWACIIMVVYAFAANMPCVIAQRYNRIRLLMILSSMKNRINTVR